MSAARQKLAIAAAVLLILTAAAYAVWQFERILTSGHRVIVQLAPVDPRSLMQGDYMALAYAIDRALPEDAPHYRYALLTSDEQGVAQLHSLSNRLPTEPELIAMQLRARNGIVSIGPNAFFFNEGQAEQYNAAEYGQFRVDASGKALLTALLDDDLQLLGDNKR
jgi:uncharacterized membrane-anchored protein